MHQVVDREPVAEMRPRLHQIIIRLLNRRARLLLLRREIDIQSFAERRAEAVDGQNFALRILLAQLVRRDAAGLIRRAQPGREADIEHIQPRGQHRLHLGAELFGIDGARRALRSGAQLVKEILERNLAPVEIVVVGLSIYRHVQRQHPQIQLVGQALRQVAGRIGDDLKQFRHGVAS